MFQKTKYYPVKIDNKEIMDEPFKTQMKIKETFKPMLIGDMKVGTVFTHRYHKGDLWQVLRKTAYNGVIECKNLKTGELDVYAEIAEHYVRK